MQSTMSKPLANQLPAGVTVGDVMNTWIMQMGFPVVTFTRNAAGDKVTLTQKHFLRIPQKPIREYYPSAYKLVSSSTYFYSYSFG